MDEKYKSNLLGFLKQDQEAWDNIWSEDAGWDKGEIGSCCSSHALGMLVALIDPKADDSPSEIAEAIAPALNDDIKKAIKEWTCDDYEHNDDIKKIYKWCLIPRE